MSVLVNDRGPWAKGRRIDLNRAAANAIGMDGAVWLRIKLMIAK